MLAPEIYVVQTYLSAQLNTLQAAKFSCRWIGFYNFCKIICPRTYFVLLSRNVYFIQKLVP